MMKNVVKKNYITHFTPRLQTQVCLLSPCINPVYYLDGKYVVLPSGELQIRNVTAEDGFKTYKCRTKHRLTGILRYISYCLQVYQDIYLSVYRYSRICILVFIGILGCIYQVLQPTGLFRYIYIYINLYRYTWIYL